MRRVLCSKFKETLDGLSELPFPGELGKEIYKSVSDDAWNEWLSRQTMIINEYKLDLSEENDRELLKDQMKVFLGLKEAGSVKVLTLGNTEE